MVEGYCVTARTGARAHAANLQIEIGPCNPGKKLVVIQDDFPSDRVQRLADSADTTRRRWIIGTASNLLSPCGSMWKRWLYSFWWLLLIAPVAHAQLPLPNSTDAVPADPFSLLPGSLSAQAHWLGEIEDASEKEADVQHVAAVQSAPQFSQFDLDRFQGADASQYSGSFASRPERFNIGLDLYSAPEFDNGLIVVGKDVAMKFGGYVKADFIYDFNPIDSTDSFITTSIPVGAPDRTNTRAHARQTRLSFDTRWKTSGRVVQVFVEGDFFSDDDQFRLRHAYGEVGSLLVGQTWTTFTDVGAAPATLDFEGSVSNVNRRQAQARWTQPILGDAITLAVALEDTRFIVIEPPSLPGDARSPSPMHPTVSTTPHFSRPTTSAKRLIWRRI